MWGGRFAEGPSAIMREINASIPFDKALWRQDIAASKAHVAMLGAQGIVSSADASAISDGLDTVAAEYEANGVPEDWDLEDIHMVTESRLAELIEQIKADKVIHYVKRRRKHSSQRTKGHRQQLTLLRVTDVLASGAEATGVMAATGTADARRAAHNGGVAVAAE